jgi:hypothetical protein
LNDTWVWDGLNWTQEQQTGPAARWFHAMAYDAGRDRIIVVGGRTNATAGGQVNNTWEYDGTTCTLVTDYGPEARWGGTLNYDGTVSLLCGGTDGTNSFSRTWQWDGAHWTQRQDFGPASRSLAGAAYDSVRERLVLFGGQTSTGTQVFGDTWEAYSRPAAVQIA